MAEFSIFPRKMAQSSGQVFYFTGKKCKRGHIDQRYTSTGACVTCSHEAGSQWSRDHVMENRARVGRYYSRHKEELKTKRKNKRDPTMLNNVNVIVITRNARNVQAKHGNKKMSFELE